MTTISTLEGIIWLTLLFSFLSVVLLLLAGRTSCRETQLMNELVDQDKKLSDSILLLQNKFFDLDEDLKRLTKDNAILRKEIRMLNERMNNLQIQIRIKEGENAPGNN